MTGNGNFYMRSTGVPYPVANWKERSQYSENIVARIRAAGLDESYEVFRESFAETDLFIERDIAQLWRWEFLRRLPQYQCEWNDPACQKCMKDRYGLLAEVPDPAIVCPVNLRFWDVGRLNERYIFHYYVDVRDPITEQQRGLARKIKEFRKLTGVNSDQLPSRKQYPKLLRVLDADLSGASKAEIGRVLRKGCSNPSKAGTELLSQAKRAQLLITRVIP